MIVVCGKARARSEISGAGGDKAQAQVRVSAQLIDAATMRRCWFFIFPFLGSCPMASRHGQWQDPRAGVTECCSLLPGHREITAQARRLFKEAGAEGLSFELLNRNVDQPFKYVATWL